MNLSAADFEIEISGGDGHYRAVARSAAGETGPVSVDFPFDEQTMEVQRTSIEFALLKSSTTVRRLAHSDERPVQEFGTRLFNFAFPPAILTQLRVGLQDAARQDSRLKILLRIEPPELASLPWEFLHDSDRDDYLSLSTSFVRYIDVPEPHRPLAVSPPLQILAMVAAPKDLDALNIEREKQQLQRALKPLERSGRVRLSWASGQTWQDLQRSLDEDRWHVLHFIGHGGFDEEAGEGVLAFADPQGDVQQIGATDLALLVSGNQSLRLVVLNSCETARGAPRDRFSSTASVLMRRGIPAVIAMQYNISDGAAIAFAKGLYSALAAQHPVDQAVTRARMEIKFAQRHTLEWGTPVLYLRSPSGEIFDITRGTFLRRRLLRAGAGVIAVSLVSVPVVKWISKPNDLEMYTESVPVAQVDDHGTLLKPTGERLVNLIRVPIAGDVSLELCSIPGGRFKIGSPVEEEAHRANEGPMRDIHLSPFAMGRTVITQAQWLAVVSAHPEAVKQELRATPSQFPGADLPVESISWNEANEFCSRLSRLTGRNFRLPSEAEWEYACRAGTSTPFNFGPTITPKVANYCGAGGAVCPLPDGVDGDPNYYDGKSYTSGRYGAGPMGEPGAGTVAADRYPANQFGLFQMHGNVWEHCADVAGASYAQIPADGSPYMASDSPERCLRGGSWSHNPAICRSAYRDHMRVYETGWPGRVGMRVVCTLWGT